MPISSRPKPLNKKHHTAQPSVSKKRTEEFVDTFIVVPPDGGWGWVVVIGSFFGNFIGDGVMYTFGLFLSEMSESFNTSTTKIALANSIMIGFYYLLGPLVSGLTNRYGFRTIAVTGGILASISFLISSFTHSLSVLLLSYGVLGGFGFSMIYIPSVVVIGFYFERWRAIATAIAVSGSSAGIIAFPPAMEEFLKSYNWRVKFRILSGGCLIGGLFGMLYRPIEPIRIVSTDSKSVQIAMSAIQHTDREENVGCCYKFKRFHNKRYPTTAEVYKKSAITIVEPTRRSNMSIVSTVSDIKNVVDSSTASFDKNSARFSTIYEDERKGRFRINFKCLPCSRKRRTVPTRPLYRDDIFFGGSLMTLPEYTGSLANLQPIDNVPVAVDYHMSVSRVTTQRDFEESDATCLCCAESLMRPLVTMLDMSLLKSPSFLLLAFSGFFTVLGVYTPFMYISERAIKNGLKTDFAVMLISIVGISNFVGRVVSGILISLPKVNPMLTSIVFLYLSGFSTLISTASITEIVQIAYCVIFGSTIACLASIRTIIVVDLVGLEKLTNGYGILLTFYGLAGLMGVPISGFLIDLTGEYTACFVFAGCSIIFSSTLLVPIHKVVKWERDRSANR